MLALYVRILIVTHMIQYDVNILNVLFIRKEGTLPVIFKSKFYLSISGYLRLQLHY